MDIAEQSHWEHINTERRNDAPAAQHGFRAWFSRPPARTMFNELCDRFFTKDRQKKVLEVGCAPGLRLLEFADRYAYQPYGVDYSAAGVQVVRQRLRARGIPEDHCIHADVFDAAFQKTHHQEFDVVMSFGVIEHFTNVDSILQAHLALLKPGGTLLIMIPRLVGVYYPLTKLLAPRLLPKHNLSIMHLGPFRELFRPIPLRVLYAGYYGLLNLGMLQGHGTVRHAIVRLLQLGQVILNPLLRHGHRCENRVTSPYLLYLGRGETTSASHD